MKREIFGLIRGVTMAMGVLWIPRKKEGEESHYHYFSTQLKTFPATDTSVSDTMQPDELVRWGAWWILVNKGMSWVTEIPVMTSFTLSALSNQADIYTEMKWQPRPNVLSGLIRSAAFNANLLWIFHLSFIMYKNTIASVIKYLI